ncbi:MAG: aspartate kinase [Erysipelotrichaceae bacterium]|nr:aspartate kinase [Erysipelotrichaceae bacterium]
MKIKVMKFGGTSLRSEATRKYVYRHIHEALKDAKVIVVVSAMGRYPDAYATDTLLSMGSDLITKEERARLVSIGEQLSAIKICSELLDMGVRAFSLAFGDSGIRTDNNYDYAKVIKLDHKEIKTKLNEYDVIVVGGFIATSYSHKITTLGRGGSDYSAVLFAHMLGLQEVDIYTDVDGVYDHDPKLNEFAVRYDKLSYDEMLNMKSRVLHDRSVVFAKKHGLRIHLKGTFSNHAGTVIEG